MLGFFLKKISQIKSNIILSFFLKMVLYLSQIVKKVKGEWIIRPGQFSELDMTGRKGLRGGGGKD